MFSTAVCHKSKTSSLRLLEQLITFLKNVIDYNGAQSAVDGVTGLGW